MFVCWFNRLCSSFLYFISSNESAKYQRSKTHTHESLFHSVSICEFTIHMTWNYWAQYAPFFMQIALDQMSIQNQRTQTHRRSVFSMLLYYMSIKSRTDIQLPCCSLLLIAYLSEEEEEQEEEQNNIRRTYAFILCFSLRVSERGHTKEWKNTSRESKRERIADTMAMHTNDMYLCVYECVYVCVCMSTE